MSYETRELERGNPSASTTLLDLPSGKGLTTAQTAAITTRSFVSVVLFAGTADCGKTTLLATLYLLFQKGPFAGYIFAGSDTLVGFENRLYLARIASGQAAASTPRTRVSEYLHLRVRRQDLSQPIRDMLLCDLSGEDFRGAKDDSETCKGMKIISRADRFVLLIDGKKMSDEATKQTAKNDPLMLLRNCLETGRLNQNSIIDVLFTKWDIVEAHVDKNAILAFAEHIEKEIRERSNGRVRQIQFSRVASQPIGDNLPLGYGLVDLFPPWVEAIWGNETTVRPPIREATSLTEYDRYYRRRLTALFLPEEPQ
jgi:hypothetical protein